VPKVEWPLTTKRVLTMEFIQGCKINDTEKINQMGIDIKEAAGLVIGECFIYTFDVVVKA